MIVPFSRFIIHGNSMLPTLKPGQDVLCFNWAYIFSKPKKGDIVVVKHQDKELVKCIQTCYGRCIFVTGDNHKESIDSRVFGAIDRSQLAGKIIWY